MNYFFTIVLLALAVSQPSFAFNESPVKDDAAQEAQLDNIFETNQNAQLKIDQEYAATDVKQSETELGAEKSKISDLKAQNTELTKEIKKDIKVTKENRRQAKIAAIKAARLERQVKMEAKKLEKLKIANVNLKKSIEKSQKKQKTAEAKLKQVQSHRKVYSQLHKKLAQKKQASRHVLKGKKVARANKYRTAQR
jgi:hypothetical protein